MKTTLALLAAAALLAAGAAHAASATTCGSLSAGPGSLVHGSSAGARCLLRAFRSCSPASYVLSTFGVDTIRQETFTVVRSGSRCSVAVATAFRVVPRPVRTLGAGTCTTLAARGTDVVATGCAGVGLGPTVSLTGAGGV